MKLIRLSIENFKGCKTLVFEPDGKSCSIYGTNATGKTTIMDSCLWLLTGKDSLDQAAFEIKPLDDSGDPAHNLSQTVEGVFSVSGGETLTLKKVFQEKYTKKRGQAQAELTGHETHHFINDVPVSEREYKTRISEIAEEKLFKLLANVRYFNEVLTWQDRRRLLLEVCGDISDADVIASHPQLAKLPGILGRRTVDEYRKISAGRKTKINEELKEIPARVDEAQKSKTDVNGTTKVGLQDELNGLQSQVKEKRAEQERILTGGEIAEKTKKLREIEGKLIEIQNREAEAANAVLLARRNEVAKVKSEAQGLLSVIKTKTATLERSRSLVAKFTLLRDELRAYWESVRALVFSKSLETVCPIRGQEFPPECAQAVKEKALSVFNQDKAKQLEKINKVGKAYKADQESLETEIPVIEKEITGLQSKANELSKKVLSLEAQLAELTEKKPWIADQINNAKNTEKAKLYEGKAILESAISELQLGSHDQTEDLKTQIVELEKQIEAKQALIAQIDNNYRLDQRTRELEAKQKELAREFEQIEGGLFLTDLFVKTKVSMLTDKINGKFSYVSFKLFGDQMNGGVQEMCECMVSGIPYRSLNEASRINSGIEIANVMSEHYGVSLPLWIDGAESVVEILPSSGQQIRLVVSETDKTLRFEMEQ